jgi:CRP/FNR family transcriptional regulator
MSPKTPKSPAPREAEATAPSPVAEIGERLAKLELFAGVDRSFIMSIAASGQMEKAYRRQTIIEEGETNDAVFVILEGRASVQIEAIAPHVEVDINRLGPGDIIGESVLFEERPRTATVIAIEPLVVFVTTGAAIREAIAANPAQGIVFQRNVARTLMERLREMNRRVVSMRRARSW